MSRSQIWDGSAWVDMGGGSTAFSGARATRTSDYSIPSASTTTAIPWQAEDIDTDGYWESVTNPSRFTAPIDGTYRVTACLAFTCTASSDVYTGYWINGSAVNSSHLTFGRAESIQTYDVIQNGSDVVELSAGDYVEIVGTCSGTTRDVRNIASFGSLQLIRDEGIASTTGMFDLLHSWKPADTPDDEFESTTLDSKWTAVAGSSGTVDFLSGPSSGNAVYDLASRPGWMLMQGNNLRAQLRQDYTLPDGASMVAALSAPVLYTGADTMTNNNSLATFTLNDTDTGLADGVEVWIGLETEVNGYYIISKGDGVTKAATNLSTEMATAFSGGVLFFRFTREGLVYYMHYSLDGSSWSSLDSYTASGALTNVWLAGGSLIAGTPAPICGWKWVRQGTNDLDPWDPTAAAVVLDAGWGPWIDVDGGVGFENSWVNQGGQDAEYRKHTDGLVQLRGIIKDGTINTAAFTLPSGYRPPATSHHAVISNTLTEVCYVLSTGVVNPRTGSNTWYSIDGVFFDSNGGS